MSNKEDFANPNSLEITTPDQEDEFFAYVEYWDDFREQGLRLQAGQQLKQYKGEEDRHRMAEITQENLQFVNTLPRKPIPLHIVRELLDDNDADFMDEFLRGAIPDHVEEARIECVYQFLEKYLLPRLCDTPELYDDDFVKEAYKFRKEFRRAHPNDFIGELHFIPSIEFILLQLVLYYGITRETLDQANSIAQIVWKAYQVVHGFIEDEPIDLCRI